MYIRSLVKTRLYSWNFCNVKLCQLCPLKIPESKTKSTGNSNFFSYHPWRFNIFFNQPLEILHSVSSVPLEIPCPQFSPTPCLFFSWNSPMLEKVQRANSKRFSLLVTKVTFLKWKTKILGKTADLYCKRNMEK